MRWRGEDEGGWGGRGMREWGVGDLFARVVHVFRFKLNHWFRLMAEAEGVVMWWVVVLVCLVMLGNALGEGLMSELGDGLVDAPDEYTLLSFTLLLLWSCKGVFAKLW